MREELKVPVFLREEQKYRVLRTGCSGEYLELQGSSRILWKIA
jgi:hypothetical protein